jgi:hypothetical protein
MQGFICRALHPATRYADAGRQPPVTHRAAFRSRSAGFFSHSKAHRQTAAVMEWQGARFRWLPAATIDVRVIYNYMSYNICEMRERTTMAADPQTEIHSNPRGRIMAMDSAYHVGPANRDRDVVLNASYCGVLPARFIAEHRPRAAIGVDCGIGPAGASIAGLWYLEALEIPAAAADVMTVRLGDGTDLFENGLISVMNRPAADCGVRPGMPVKLAAQILLDNDPAKPGAAQVTNRTIVERGPDDRLVVCTDSIAFGLEEDRRNVLVTAGHTGRSAVPYLLAVQPFGFICSDGGMGREASGIAGLLAVEAAGLAGATVDARTARMGDGLSTYHDGVISAANRLALDAGVAIGMPAREASSILVHRTIYSR